MKIFVALSLITFFGIGFTKTNSPPFRNSLPKKTFFSCEDRIRTDVDSVEGTYSRSSKENIVVSKDGKNGLTFLILETDQTIVLSITAVGAGDCVDEKNKITIKFRDGSQLVLPNNGKFNCDGEFSLFFNGGFGKKKELDMLRTKEIESAKVETRKSTIDKTRKNFVEEVFPSEKSKLLMETIDCISKE